MIIDRNPKVKSDRLHIFYMDNYDVQIYAINQLISSNHTNLITRRYFEYLDFEKLKKNLFDDDIQFDNIVKEDEDSIKTCSFSSKFETQFDDVFIIDINEDIIPSNYNKEDEDNKSLERQLLYDIISIARQNVYLFSSDKPSIFLKELENKATKIVGSFNNPEKWKGYDKPFGHPDRDYNPLKDIIGDDLPF
ncbi:MAG: hypothetical protein PF484_07725 [Bacteroidales bacterium]|jgi:superfamily I DNA/RNA helicase|nr:hypothetical protein [Bacteroidales bacterium]